MSPLKSRFLLIASALAIVTLVALSSYIFFHRKPPAQKNLQALAIESKGLLEFSAENDKANKISPEDKKLAEQMMPVITLIGDAKDAAKDRQAIAALNDMIGKYPDYSDLYFLRATVSVAAGDKDYQQVLSDIDKAIQFHSSPKYDKMLDSTAEMYVLRAKVDILADNNKQAVNDIEMAVKGDPSHNPFNTGGVKPEEDSNPTALQKRDFDSLVVQYPDDYRVYMFRGLFYGSFTSYDEQYYAPALDDLRHARNLNLNSALVDYLLGSVYQKGAFFTKAAASDISESGGYKDKANTVALQYFNEAIKLDPKFTEAQAQVAESLYNLRRYSEAIPYYSTVIEFDPNRYGAYNDRGLAKTYVNNSYGAIEDFSESIRLKKTESDFALDNTYENRAAAYVKVRDFQRAVEDYSRAIGIKFSSQVFLMSVTQIRSIYPEFRDIPDQDLLEGLRQKYFPTMSYSDFSGQYQKNNKPFEDFILAGLYVDRADSYLAEGNFGKAASEYARAIHSDSTYVFDRWKVISKAPDTEVSIDSQTLNFSQGNIVSLWTKTVRPKSPIYSEENYQIDCASEKIKLISSVNYNSDQVLNSKEFKGDWGSVAPESLGELLYNGMCGNK
jgi:tetratricopeptide (TPR) repeat protein